MTSAAESLYGALGRDSVDLVSRHLRLDGARMLDVGAGRPQFAEAFTRAGATYVGLDAEPDALDDLAGSEALTVAADGRALPFADGCVDLAFCSNVFEHVRAPERLADELVRVTRPGGVVVVSYTNWLSPWGGHETSPFHYLGGERAIRRYRRHYGFMPKNRVGENLHRTSVAQGLRWARGQRSADLVEAMPRYYPSWAQWLVQVPAVREVVTWTLWLLLRRR